MKKQNEMKCGSVNLTKRVSTFLMGAALALCLTTANLTAADQLPVDLGSAANFAVLAGPAVTFTDSIIYTGDVGIFSPVPPGSSVTQTNSTINGTVHEGDAVAVQAYSDFLSAYNALALQQCDTYLTGNLAGQVLAPGVYCVGAESTTTNGTLTLSGSSNGIWIFKIGASGTGALTGTNFSVVMEGGGLPCNVYWWVAEAATMTDSNFQGTILAGAAITITRGTFNGGALAQAAVTMTGSTYPSPVAEETAATSNITVSGTNAADVAATVTGGGFINVVNNGAHVAATQTGTGTINIVNNGGVLTATNTGNGVMTINSTATGAVTVTNTGNGRVTVTASGAAAITLTHTGDDDFTYPN